MSNSTTWFLSAALAVYTGACSQSPGGSSEAGPLTDSARVDTSVDGTNREGGTTPDSNSMHDAIVVDTAPSRDVVIDRPPVGACNGLAAPGTWEDITPAAARFDAPGNCFYGGSFVIDRNDSRSIYLGSCQAGFWHSGDCGASWTKVDTGMHHEDVDSGRQWTMIIDPVDSTTIYLNSGYNLRDLNNSTLYKSTNSGVDFTQIWPPANLSGVPAFVGGVEMDRTDHTHLLLSFHAACSAPYNNACMGESRDGGLTWTIVNGDPSWVGGEGAAIFFLNDSDNWLWQSQTNGMWRTTNHGSSWTLIGAGAGHGAGALYRTPGGTYLHGSTDGILRSLDAVTWTLIANSGDLIEGLAANGTTIYSSRGFPWNSPGVDPYEPFRTSTDDGLTWAPMPSPMLSNGGELIYDGDHHILYSSNLNAGFWRVVVP